MARLCLFKPYIAPGSTTEAKFFISVSQFSLPPHIPGEKRIWKELGLNSGPLALQTPAVTTKPWLRKWGGCILEIQKLDTFCPVIVLPITFCVI